MNTHFAVLGRQKKLSIYELTWVVNEGYNVQWSVVFFTIDDENKLKHLGGIKKRGRLFGDLEQLWEGLEIHSLEEWHGLVLWRQHIWLYEKIDFDKPVSGMEIGMMPSKLAHLLVNIWIAQIPVWDISKDITIRDPFVGFGTTGFIVNNMWHNFIWSDMNIVPFKTNKKWRLTIPLAQEDKHFTAFKHDMHDPLTQPFLEHVDVIVTEWRLGPVIKKNPYKLTRKYGQATAMEAFDRGITEIVNTYTDFIQNVFTTMPTVPVVMTVPHYTFMDEDTIWEKLEAKLTSIWADIEQVDIYARKKQKVARRVVIVKKR